LNICVSFNIHAFILWLLLYCFKFLFWLWYISHIYFEKLIARCDLILGHWWN
jgi:hypothetical protein